MVAATIIIFARLLIPPIRIATTAGCSRQNSSSHLLYTAPNYERRHTLRLITIATATAADIDNTSIAHSGNTQTRNVYTSLQPLSFDAPSTAFTLQ